MTLAYSQSFTIWLTTFRIDFECRGWPPQPPIEMFSKFSKTWLFLRLHSQQLDQSRSFWCQIIRFQIFLMKSCTGAHCGLRGRRGCWGQWGWRSCKWHQNHSVCKANINFDFWANRNHWNHWGQWGYHGVCGVRGPWKPQKSFWYLYQSIGDEYYLFFFF